MPLAAEGQLGEVPQLLDRRLLVGGLRLSGLLLHGPFMLTESVSRSSPRAGVDVSSEACSESQAY